MWQLRDPKSLILRDVSCVQTFWQFSSRYGTGMDKFVGYLLVFVLKHYVCTEQCLQSTSFSGDFSFSNVRCANGILWFVLSHLTGLCSLCQGCIHCFGSSNHIWTFVLEESWLHHMKWRIGFVEGSYLFLLIGQLFHCLQLLCVQGTTGGPPFGFGYSVNGQP